MIIIIVTSIPMQLRGYLTRFLVEPSTGVFVGHVSARVRGKLWAKVEECMGAGKATLVYTTDNEQGYSISYLNRSDREMVDLDGWRSLQSCQTRRSPSLARGGRRPSAIAGTVVGDHEYFCITFISLNVDLWTDN